MENHPLTKLARESVEAYIKEGKIIEPPATLSDRYLKDKAGTFVSIHQGRDLRGCIGTYMPTKENIAKEIIDNAIQAATCDPRFDCIETKDLPQLSYEVYTLDKPQPAASIEELDPKIYGIIVIGVESQKCGLLLPGLKGIDNASQQISIAVNKAGIDPEKEKLKLFKFLAQKFL